VGGMRGRTTRDGFGYCLAPLTLSWQQGKLLSMLPVVRTERSDLAGYFFGRTRAQA
jgi:hypothetical protein